MQALINGLLEYSRVGTKGNVPAPANADDALKEALANLQALIQESGAVITSDPLPKVRADAIQLAHVFQNLIANAIKFRSEETPQIHVGSRRQDGSWLFWVRDNGIGIDPQYNERIFMIFQRLHTRTQIPRHRHRPGDLQADRRTPRGQHLGGIPAGQGIDLLLYIT